MQPGDRLVCTFVEPLAKGSEFRAWPLHLTIVPWFRNGIETDKLTTEIEQALTGINSFIMTVGGEAHFGHGKKLVNLIKLPSPITKVEQIVRQILKAHDSWLVDETTKVRRIYKPHVTEQTSARLHEGDKVIVDGLYIVEQCGDYKRVVNKVNLNG